MTDRNLKDGVSFIWPKPVGLIIIASVGIGVIVLGLLLSSQYHWIGFLSYKVMLIFLGALFLALPVAVYCDSAQGTFTLDHDGIRQDPLFRKSRYLRWEAIERVKWGELSCCLEGKGTGISMKFVPISRPAKMVMERLLSSHFDLSIKPIRKWSFDPDPHSFLRWLAKVIGIALAGVTLFIVPLTALIFLHSSYWLQVGWFGLFYLAIIIFCARGARVYRRSQEQINPTWRLRRQEGQPN